jgi:hypothetical protein
MLRLESMSSVCVIVGGIGMVHMMRKAKAKHACGPHPSILAPRLIEN